MTIQPTEFSQFDIKAVRGLFKELEVQLDELRGHL
jgi:hypothetical protein